MNLKFHRRTLTSLHKFIRSSIVFSSTSSSNSIMKMTFKCNIFSSASSSRVFLLIFVYGFPNNISSEGNPENERIEYEDISEYESLFLSRPVTKYPSIKLGEGLVYRLELEEPAEMEKAREKIKETPQIMETRKEELKKKLKKNTDGLRVPWKNDAWLIRFLRARDYDLTLTYDLIKRYYEFKEENRVDIFDGLLPSGEKKTFQQEVVMVLPLRDQEKRRIILVRPKKWDPDAFPFVKIFRILILYLELGVYEPTTQIVATQFIIDVADLGRKQIFGVNMIQKFKDWTLNCIPFHIENVHIINTGFFFKLAWGVFKPWLPQDLQDKVKVHKSLDDLHKDIFPFALPNDYTRGTTYPMYTIRSEEWDTLLAYQDQEYKILDSKYGIIGKNGIMNLESVDVSQGHIPENVIAPQPPSIEVY